MFKKLHLQFTLFSAAITSLILIGMSLFCLVVIENQTKSESFISFQNNINSILSHLEGQSLISHQWIRQMESAYHLELFIWDNGVPFFFDFLTRDDLSVKLADQAKAEALEQYSLNLDNPTQTNLLSLHQEFPMDGLDGQDYYVSAALIPRGSGYLTMAALYSMKTEDIRIWKQRLLFAAADCIAVVLLWIFAFFFAKRMIRPIEDNRQKQIQFIASASHELRSPLAVMLNSLSAMKKASPTEALRFSDNIQHEGERMSRLIDDMLALANADSHTWTMHPTALELDTLLLQTYEKFEPLAYKKGISFDVELPESELRSVQGDPERISQVLSILIDNAFSYTPEGGRVVISLSQTEGRTQIKIADNGPGIADEQKDLIFDRFYRIDQAHKEKEHFGLGLCIAQEIMRLHRGSIQVTDTPGGGATFLLLLGTVPD